VIEEPEDLPPMMTDEGKISQILRNLLSNAIKFTEKGEIRVSASLGHMGKTIRFEVSDTGIGIPPEYLERIFEEYTQVDSPLHMKHKGTGLGLPLSRKLAQLLGGSLCIESELGAGSVFTAEIPVQPPAEGIAETVQLLSVDVMKYPVLVIEDDEATTMLYQKFLRDSGFQVLGIRTLSAARSALGSVKPLAIILDIILDGESGWDFLSELKSDERTRDIPVFVATILEDENRGYRSGADEFITKPVERKWLLAKLGSLTEGNSSDTVLVIDDDAVARYIMKGLLAGTKYSVLDAESGFEGIEMARTRFPGIIFLDLMMPGMDGFETLEKLKADPATREIPVVIVSSKTLDAEERRILNEKTLAILPKTHASREAAIGSIRNAILKIAARSA
jgi:CheY-like chemotaxis protein